MTVCAFITGIAGTVLTPDERAFLRDAMPWGLILFKRNVDSPEQVRSLVASFRELVGRPDAPILVDQEGGRVQRLGPPHWPAYPPAAAYGQLYDDDHETGLQAARLSARLIASDLAALGISVDCLPVADLPADGADPIIGDRAYGTSAGKVSALANAASEGLMDGGVLPVVKHIPGHGRATVDSHNALPYIDASREDLESCDFKVFRQLAHLPMAMTAHVVFTAIDPVAPATTSATIVGQVIRRLIGFDGLLMSDDISMDALKGTVGERSRAAIAAGCDVVLHCNGRRDEMRAVAEAVPTLAGDAQRRARAALSRCRPPAPIDLADARAQFAALMGRRSRAGVA
jgi:beta-N-acetylhexosaminidase